MLLSKDEITRMIDEGKLVKDLIDKNKQAQASGVDLTVGKIFSLRGTGCLDFTNEKRKLPEYEEIMPLNDKWLLDPGPYNIAINETIILPKNIAAIVFPRSSSLVCGLEVHSALWDPGYEGRGFLYINVSRQVEIHKNARIGQMIFMKTDGYAQYEGVFKGEDMLQNKKRGL